MKMLVTGGAGFIGSHLVETLLSGGDGGARVTVLDDLSTFGGPANLEAVVEDPRVTFVEGDVRDSRLVDEIVPGHDVIVHTAAETHVDR